MKVKEKLKKIYGFAEKDELTDEQYAWLERFSTDRDTFVRSETASILFQFVNERAKQILLFLANDKNYFVRVEAYDSLSAFAFAEVALFLQKKIFTEKNELAKGYAILSWADVTGKLQEKRAAENLEFIEKSMIHDGNDWIPLCWYYAQYRLGNRECINNIFSCLYSEDYHVRHSAISTLNEFLDPDNCERIRMEIEKVYQNETAVSVRDAAMRLLRKTSEIIRM